MEKKKIVFLYTEIANYFIAACEALIKRNFEVHIIRYPVNKEAPFKFQIPKTITVYERDNFTNKKLFDLVHYIQPEIIVCSGWIDKGYLKICKLLREKSITILTLDNHWRGDLKQRIAQIISPFFFVKIFSKCWVPGTLQFEYALKLGFKKENILTDFYTCDFDMYYNQYQINKEQKKKIFPKKFIYVGRYYDFKGINDLWKAYIELQEDTSNDWDLWCFGTGDIKPVQYPKIKHFGFVQPNELSQYVKDCGVFVLPSHFEPWGVVIHEFAAAGFPIISSDKVGANTSFVENGWNGYIFQSGNISELKNVLKNIMQLNNSELNRMAERSVDKAKLNTPEKWAAILTELIK